MATGVAYLGCGYVADLYEKTLLNWQGLLELRGAFDRDEARLHRFCAHYGHRAYSTFEALLEDETVAIVLNLTSPDKHYETSRRCLLAGKHVYSEKPLALRLDEARALVRLARERGLHIASAPSSVLGEAAQTLWRNLRDEICGPPRLVYAELDDGMVHRIGYENWRTESGACWPAESEFRTGCTLEHAGYALTWLVAMFGGAQRVVGFSSCLIRDKGPKTPPGYATPDMSVGVLEFRNGVVARLTNSIIATHDHRFRIFCDDGVLGVDETWDNAAAVRSTPILTSRIRRQLQKKIGWDGSQIVQPVRRRRISSARRGYPMDFALGPAEMAEAIAAGRPPRLAGEFALHITEVSLAIQHPEIYGTDYVPGSSPPPMEPMPWGSR